MNTTQYERGGQNETKHFISYDYQHYIKMVEESLLSLS